MTPEAVRHAPGPPLPPSFPRTRESIPDKRAPPMTPEAAVTPPAHPHLRHSRERGNPSPTACGTYDTGSSPSRRPAHPYLRHSRERGNPSPTRCATYDTGSSPSRRPAHPYLRHSRERGNPSPTTCATYDTGSSPSRPRPNQVGNLRQLAILTLRRSHVYSCACVHETNGHYPWRQGGQLRRRDSSGHAVDCGIGTAASGVSNVCARP